MAGIPAWHAYLVLTLVACLALFGLWTTWNLPAPSDSLRQGESGQDLKLYSAIVDRIRAGEGYYDVAGKELLARGYATRPFFNWRLPTLAVFLAACKTAVVTWMVMACAVFLAIGMWAAAFKREAGGFATAAGTTLVLLALCGFLGGHSLYFHEVWAGLFISLSLAARGCQRVGLSLLFGVLALSIREHAVLYAGIMAGAAAFQGRRIECTLWSASILAFVGGLALHAHTVSLYALHEGRTNEWLRMGGWSFVISTATWSGIFNLLPQSVTAVLLPFCLLGLAHWKSPLGTRTALTVLAYLLLFLFVGRPDNFYWGVLYAPLLTLGFLHAPHAVLCLLRSIQADPDDSESPPP